MAIRYKGIEFDTVKELREYQDIEGSEEEKPEPEPQPSEDELKASIHARAGELLASLELPTVFPLHESARGLLEKIIITAVANKSSITYNDVKQLPLVEGHEWGGRTWRAFCDQFVWNWKKIAVALNIKGEFTVSRQGDYHVLLYSEP